LPITQATFVFGIFFFRMINCSQKRDSNHLVLIILECKFDFAALEKSIDIEL
jgi:hypothetical protein